MITDNQTNTVYFSGLLPKKCPILNAHITEALKKHGIPYAYLSETKDIWCRDFMPIQIERERFVFYKYTPDYLKDTLRSGWHTLFGSRQKRRRVELHFMEY